MVKEVVKEFMKINLMIRNMRVIGIRIRKMVKVLFIIMMEVNI